MQKKIILFLLASCCFASGKILDTSGMLLSRQKRTLIFQEGLNWIQMVIGIGLPIEIKDNSITMGVAMKSYYELPNNSSDFTHPSIDLARGKRSTSRWRVYSAIQDFAHGFGYKDGKSCLLRAICESSTAPFDERAGILAEILHLLLTPSSTDEAIESHFDQEYHAAERLGRQAANCAVLFPECDAGFITRFTRVFSNS